MVSLASAVNEYTLKLSLRKREEVKEEDEEEDKKKKKPFRIGEAFQVGADANVVGRRSDYL